MEYWQLLSIAGIFLVILEMFTPAMFFLNLALACFICAGLSLYYPNWNIIIPAFVVISGALLVLLRPILMRRKTSPDQKTGLAAKYIGKEVKVVETITKNSGVISIYDERWEARTTGDEQIEAGQMARIIRTESLVMFVEKA